MEGGSHTLLCHKNYLIEVMTCRHDSQKQSITIGYTKGWLSKQIPHLSKRKSAIIVTICCTWGLLGALYRPSQLQMGAKVWGSSALPLRSRSKEILHLLFWNKLFAFRWILKMDITYFLFLWNFHVNQSLFKSIHYYLTSYFPGVML